MYNCHYEKTASFFSASCAGHQRHSAQPPARLIWEILDYLIHNGHHAQS